MVFEGAWTAWTTRDIRKSLLQLPLHKTRATFTGSSRNDLEIDQTAKEPRRSVQDFSRRLSAIDIWQNLPEKVVEAPVLDLRQLIALRQLHGPSALAGQSASELYRAGVSAQDLREAGFSLGELKDCGYSASSFWRVASLSRH